MTDTSTPEARSRLEAYEAAAALRPRDAVSGAMQRSRPADATTVLDLFDAADRAAAAVTYFDQTLDYAALDQLSDRLAAWLQNQGVGRGDRVAILLQNTPQLVIATVAAWKLAAIPVTLNPMYRVPELARLFADCTPSAIVCHDDQWAAAVEAAAGIVGPARILWASPREMQSRDDARVLPALLRSPSQAPGSAPAAQALGAVLAAASLQPIERSRPVADDIAVLLYTSGTTGVPKGAMLTHRNLVFNARTCAAHFELTPGSRIFGIAPLFHVTGFEIQMVGAFAAGASQILTYRFQPAVVLDAFIEHRPSFIIGAITVFIALMNHPGATRAHFDSLAHIYSGGAPIAPAVVAAFEQRFGRAIRSSYGMTELTAPSHLAPVAGRIPVDPASGALSIGLPTPAVDAIVIDDTGLPAGPRGHGELLVRGPNVMAGYWCKADETRQAMLGGWMHTGDVGFVDEDGWFYLVDRKKDMISASGFKVWPREVEDVLYAFAGVREAAVVGAPDAYRGETVVAFVSASEGVRLDVAALGRHCRERLAAYKCPVVIHVVAELPKTETGKITRAVLAQQLRGG
jgi:long-chain acyl-CoA synthetase